jgi:hypothetical protein
MTGPASEGSAGSARHPCRRGRGILSLGDQLYDVEGDDLQAVTVN